VTKAKVQRVAPSMFLQALGGGGTGGILCRRYTIERRSMAQKGGNCSGGLSPSMKSSVPCVLGEGPLRLTEQ